MAEAILSYQINAHDSASSTFKKVSLAAKGTKDALDDTATGAQRLSKQMDETKGKLAQLRAEFAKTGDLGLLKDIARGERELKKLQGWAAAFEDPTKQIEQKSGRMSRAFDGASASLGRAFPTGSAFANPVILGVTAAAGAIALVPAAALTAGVAAAGLGLGFIALGAYAVHNSARVQSAATSMRDTWVNAVTKAGAGTEEHFVKSLHILQNTADDTGPSLKRIFDEVTPSTVNLAHGIDGLVKNSLPGLEDGAEGAVVVLDRLALKIPELGTLAGDLGTNLKGSADGGATALNTTLGLLIGTVGTLGMVLEGSSKTLDFFSSGWGRFASGSVGVITDLFGGVDEGQKKSGESAIELAGKQAKAAEALRISAQMARDFSAAVEASTAAVYRFNGSQNENLNKNLAASQAAIALTQAQNSLGESLKTNGRSFDESTLKGAANRSALNSVAQAALDVRDKIHAQTGSQELANQAYFKAIGVAKQRLTSLGMEKAAVDALFGTISHLPPLTTPKVEERGAKQSTTNVATLDQKMKDLKDKYIKAAAHADYAEVLRLRIAMDNLRDRLVRINVRTTYSSTGQGANTYQNPGRVTVDKSRWGNVYSYANGGVRDATIAKPGDGMLVQWNERETGGEAYIPRNGDKRRNRKILSEAASWQGMQVVPMANGGVMSAANEVLGRLRSGGQIFEDLSFYGNSKNLHDNNSNLINAIVPFMGGRYTFDSKNPERTRSNLISAITSYMSAASNTSTAAAAPRTGATPARGNSGGGAPMVVQFTGPVRLTTQDEAVDLLLRARETLIRQGRW